MTLSITLGLFVFQKTVALGVEHKLGDTLGKFGWVSYNSVRCMLEICRRPERALDMFMSIITLSVLYHGRKARKGIEGLLLFLPGAIGRHFSSSKIMFSLPHLYTYISSYFCSYLLCVLDTMLINWPL